MVEDATLGLRIHSASTLCLGALPEAEKSTIHPKGCWVSYTSNSHCTGKKRDSDTPREGFFVELQRSKSLSIL